MSSSYALDLPGTDLVARFGGLTREADSDSGHVPIGWRSTEFIITVRDSSRLRNDP